MSSSEDSMTINTSRIVILRTMNRCGVTTIIGTVCRNHGFGAAKGRSRDVLSGHDDTRPWHVQVLPGKPQHQRVCTKSRKDMSRKFQRENHIFCIEKFQEMVERFMSAGGFYDSLECLLESIRQECQSLTKKGIEKRLKRKRKEADHLDKEIKK